MLIGVLALQGNFRDHVHVLNKLHVKNREVRLVVDLEDIDGLIIPGGESTTISKLLKEYKLDEAILERKLPILATCAGTIILAKDIVNNIHNINILPLLDITLERNAYGSQLNSFQDKIQTSLGNMNAIFIRAPKITRANCKILAKHNDDIVMVQQNNILATTFHPELTDNTKVHEYFLNMVKNTISKENVSGI